MSLLAVVLFTFAAVAPAPPTQVLATVNGKTITRGQVEFERVSAGISDEAAEDSVNGLVDLRIHQELVDSFLTSRSITAPVQVVEDRITLMTEAWKKRGHDLDADLKTWKLSPAWLRSRVGLFIRWKLYCDTVITDERLKAEFNKQPARWDGTRLHVRQIFFKVPQDASPEQKTERIKTAEDLRGKIVGGMISFEDAAKKFSQSPSGTLGGDVGFIGWQGRLPAAVSQAAFALKLNEVSPPVASPVGIHLVTVIEIQPGQLSLEDARPEIFDFLSQTLWTETVTAGRASAKIVMSVP